MVVKFSRGPGCFCCGGQYSLPSDQTRAGFLTQLFGMPVMGTRPQLTRSRCLSESHLGYGKI